MFVVQRQKRSDEGVNEEKEKEKRQLNLILHNIKESNNYYADCSKRKVEDVTVQCTNNFANHFELLRRGLHQWRLTLALHCLPQPGEQCFAKNGFMAEYMDF